MQKLFESKNKQTNKSQYRLKLIKKNQRELRKKKEADKTCDCLIKR